MLKMKYLNNFDGEYAQFLISGIDKDYMAAHKFFSTEDTKVLNDPRICKYYPTPEAPGEVLVNKKERKELAHLFGLLSEGGEGHYYYDIDFFPEIELRISKDEYPDSIFELEF